MTENICYHKLTLNFAGILKAKQKCLEIVHGLEVRDIKSFVNWMKTFQVEQGAAGNLPLNLKAPTKKYI